MAVNDQIWIDGDPRLFKSSGTTVTVVWVDGEPVVIHEYVSAEGGLDIAIASYHYENH